MKESLILFLRNEKLVNSLALIVVLVIPFALIALLKNTKRYFLRLVLIVGVNIILLYLVYYAFDLVFNLHFAGTAAWNFCAVVLLSLLFLFVSFATYKELIKLLFPRGFVLGDHSARSLREDIVFLVLAILLQVAIEAFIIYPDIKYGAPGVSLSYEIVSAVFLAPFLEEYIFRFSIPKMLGMSRVKTNYVVLFSVIFACMHTVSGNIVTSFVLSVCYYMVMNKTCRITFVIALHGLHNLTFVIAPYLIS